MSAQPELRPFPQAMRWFAYVCVLLLALASVAEAAHIHSALRRGPDEQHCALCMAAHAVAPPAAIVYTAVSPLRCLAILAVQRDSLPQEFSSYSLYIRPPPLF